MTTSDGQLSGGAAEIYETFFVPALFAEWAPRMADAMAVQAGDRALDVACGSGVLTRELASRLPPTQVVGLDCNDGMLAVARRQAPDIEWQLGVAESLPFADQSFTVVSCQFGLMFFEDRVRALAEMWRVLRPGGRIAVAVWDSLANTPGYAAMASLLERLFGAAVAKELEAPFCLGDAALLRDLATQGGWSEPRVQRVVGSARFASIRDWVHTDVRGWTLAEKIDDAQYERLLQAAKTELLRFTSAGQVAFDSPALILTVTKPTAA